jgi:hydroxypyruvate isomerase
MLSRRTFGRLMAAASLMPKGAAFGMAQNSDASQRFSVMMWALKNRGSFEENLERVAQAGYRHVELVGEFFKWTDVEHRQTMARMRTLGITVDATSGMKLGFADADREAYLTELRALIQAAKGVECPRLILLSGKRVEDIGDDGQRRTSIETLKRVADVLETAKMDAVIEPIDRLENPTIWLDSVEEGAAIAREVASPRVKVLYDLYHEQRTKGNLIEKLEKNIGTVGLVHVADVPGRHEPGTGEVNFTNIYRKLGELKYDGMIAMEFYPTGDVVETLRLARTEALQAFTQPQK